MASISCSSSPKPVGQVFGFHDALGEDASPFFHGASLWMVLDCGHEYRSSDRLPVRRTTGFRLALQVGENGVRLAQHDVAIL